MAQTRWQWLRFAGRGQEPVLGRSQWPLAPLRRSPARPRRPGTPGDRIRPNRHLLGLATVSHVAERDPPGARSAMGLMGANRGSQRAQTRPGPPRRLRNVTAGERLAIRPPQTRPDTGFVPGGQGVDGSNPAVPTGNRVFSNIFMSLPEPAKEPSHREMALLDSRADHVPRPPTRAFVNTAEPAKPAVKGSKIAEPRQICTATPTAANRRTPSPAHRLTASRTLTGLQ